MDKKMKGGPKGGTRFPKHDLKSLVKHINELCSKTHSKAIDIEQLNAGVFHVRTKSPAGKIKYSSLKQYGLVKGGYKDIEATELCKKINLAAEEEKKELLRKAFLKVEVFKKTLETYQGSTINKSKIKQYANGLKVHPANLDQFMDIFVSSAKFAGLCSVKDDEVTFLTTDDVMDEEIEDNKEQDSDSGEENKEDDTVDQPIKKTGGSLKPNIQINVDPTLDPEKLEKQLKILKRFGLI